MLGNNTRVCEIKPGMVTTEAVSHEAIRAVKMPCCLVLTFSTTFEQTHLLYGNTGQAYGLVTSQEK